MPVPSSDASTTGIAEWLTREPQIVDTLQYRLQQNQISTFAEVDDDTVFLKECNECTLPIILHVQEDNCDDLVGILIDNYKIPIEDIKDAGDLENLKETFDTEIRKLSWFNEALDILKEMETRTCLCRRLCENRYLAQMTHCLTFRAGISAQGGLISLFLCRN